MPVSIIYPQVAIMPDLACQTRNSSDTMNKQRRGAQYSISANFNLTFSLNRFMIARGMLGWRSLMFSRSCWSQYSTILRRTRRASRRISYLDDARPCLIIENRLGQVSQLTAQAKISALPTSHSESQSDTHSNSCCPSFSKKRWKSSPINRQNSVAYSGCFESYSGINLCIIEVTNFKRAASQPVGPQLSSMSAQTSLSNDMWRFIPMTAASSYMDCGMGRSKAFRQCLKTSARSQIISSSA